MKTILKKGYKTLPEDYVYVKKCHTCGCKFTYQTEDIQCGLGTSMFVCCPDCQYGCDITFRKKYKGDKNETN